MYTVDEQVGRGLAYFHARNEMKLPHKAAWHWAKTNWMLFLADADSPTGKLFALIARYRRRQENL